jgi:antitoxin component YwqK of YwqJK toxin-antitoxin module
MAVKKPAPTAHTEYHKDGSVWAKGHMQNGTPVGYWEWFRKDGTLMRTGSFEAGQQVGEWTTYDRHGKVVKVTQIHAKH